MRLSRKHWLLSWLLMTVILAQVLSAAETKYPGDESGELARAIHLRREWLAAFSTLRMRYRWSNPGQLMHRFPELRSDESKLDGYYHEDEFIWTDRDFCFFSTSEFQDGSLVRQTTTGRNATVQFRAVFEPGEKFPRTLDGTHLVRGEQPPFSRPMPLFQTFTGTPGWTTFPRSQAAHVIYAGTTDLDGSHCVGFRQSPASTVVNWLDLDHDGMLRATRSEQDESREFVWHCTEFQRTNMDCWFPKKGTYRDGPGSEEYWFDVLEVAMNEDIPPVTFDAPRAGEFTAINIPTLFPPRQIDHPRIAEHKLNLNLGLQIALVLLVGGLLYVWLPRSLQLRARHL